MGKKYTAYFSAGIVSLVLIILLAYISTFVKPKIIFTAEVGRISNEDYNNITVYPSTATDGKTIGQFRKISLHVNLLIHLF